MWLSCSLLSIQPCYLSFSIFLPHNYFFSCMLTIPNTLVVLLCWGSCWFSFFSYKFDISSLLSIWCMVKFVFSCSSYGDWVFLPFSLFLTLWIHAILHDYCYCCCLLLISIVQSIFLEWKSSRLQLPIRCIPSFRFEWNVSLYWVNCFFN